VGWACKKPRVRRDEEMKSAARAERVSVMAYLDREGLDQQTSIVTARDGAENERDH
jgi:hypothetical protein